MELIKQRILKRTHAGLHIYSYVLKHYYSGNTVLSLAGKDCAPVKNPFNNGESTLWIKIIDGFAHHLCSQASIPYGNAFDFAELFFRLSGDDLLLKLNKVLQLKLDVKHPHWDYNIDESDCVSSFDSLIQSTAAASVIEESPSNVQEFSYFAKPIRNVYPLENVTIQWVYEQIKGNSYKSITSQLRLIKDAKEARDFKAFNFDYVTFSGTFSKRNDSCLLTHSNLLVLDFDHIPQLDELRQQLLLDPHFETQLLFISPSGDGLKWVVEIDLLESDHKEWFQAISNYLKSEYAIQIDNSGKDVSRSCFLPHDPDVFINPKYFKNEK